MASHESDDHHHDQLEDELYAEQAPLFLGLLLSLLSLFAGLALYISFGAAISAWTSTISLEDVFVVANVLLFVALGIFLMTMEINLGTRPRRRRTPTEKAPAATSSSTKQVHADRDMVSVPRDELELLQKASRGFLLALGDMDDMKNELRTKQLETETAKSQAALNGMKWECARRGISTDINESDTEDAPALDEESTLDEVDPVAQNPEDKAPALDEESILDEVDPAAAEKLPYDAATALDGQIAVEMAMEESEMADEIDREVEDDAGNPDEPMPRKKRSKGRKKPNAASQEKRKNWREDQVRAAEERRQRKAGEL